MPPWHGHLRWGSHRLHQAEASDPSTVETTATLRVPALAAHARNELAGWDDGPGVTEADLRWLTVEYALVAVAKSDLEDAWFSVQGQGGLEMVSASGHPGAADLINALQGLGTVVSGVFPLGE